MLLIMILKSRLASSISILSLYLHHAYAAPLQLEPERWREPCQGSTSTSRQPLTDGSPIFQENDVLVAFKLYTKANDVLEVAANLLDIYVKNRIQSSDLRQSLDDNMTTPGFPDHRILNLQTMFTERMILDYRRASIVAVFLEHLRWEETNSQISPNYLTEYRTLESQIYPFLCQLRMAIQDRMQSTALSYVTRDVMHTSVREVANIAERYRRDYRLLKDIVMLFQSIREDYNLLRSQPIAVTKR